MGQLRRVNADDEDDEDGRDGDITVGQFICNPADISLRPRYISPTFANHIRLLGVRNVAEVSKNVARMMATAAEFVRDMLAKDDGKKVPPVDPSRWADMSAEELEALLAKHEGRLRLTKGDRYQRFVDGVRDDWTRFSVQGESGLWSRGRRRERRPLSFDDVWGRYKEKHPYLYEFVGELSIAYTGIVQVEGHFSRMRFYRNKWRNRLGGLRMDGCCHCAQYGILMTAALRVTAEQNMRRIEGGGVRRLDGVAAPW
eukprot:GHVU01136468.1.p1 GENE.GHVU01136468.1~~GHVU01136468.1.p1  ORF type:complete len:256 (-),score=24.70 GHVU01136468.1:801-1568(-)